MSLDLHGRPLRALRVSVTDRCNLRCQYCMPEREYVWLPKDTLLHFEEIRDLVAVFGRVGVEKVRLTGGEPLLRKDLPRLVGLLAALPSVRDLALTTNGLLLAEQAAALRAAGLHRVTVSLDTLDPGRFRSVTTGEGHARVLSGIDEAAHRFGGLKIDMVVVRGVNDDEMGAMIEFGRVRHAEVRFIEYMAVGGATRWSPASVVPRAEILERLGRSYGPARPIDETAWAPANRFALPDGTVFGIVSSTTAPFCGTCDRARLTADGVWFLCLHASAGVDLRTPLRRGVPLDDLAAVVDLGWSRRTERGAEALMDGRLGTVPVPMARLRLDSHLEMHTRGG